MLATVTGTLILFKTQFPCYVQSSATSGPRLNVCSIISLVTTLCTFSSAEGCLYKVLKLHAGPLIILQNILPVQGDNWNWVS